MRKRAVVAMAVVKDFIKTGSQCGGVSKCPHVNGEETSVMSDEHEAAIANRNNMSQLRQETRFSFGHS